MDGHQGDVVHGLTRTIPSDHAGAGRPQHPGAGAFRLNRRRQFGEVVADGGIEQHQVGAAPALDPRQFQGLKHRPLGIHGAGVAGAEAKHGAHRRQ